MCDKCGWEELLETIEEMLEDDTYEFAADTLEGIEEWVNDNEHCTPRQEEAVENIRSSKLLDKHGRGYPE